MRQLTIAEMNELTEISPEAWKFVANHFGLTPEKLREQLENGAVWVLSDEAWESFTGAINN